jgi:hypothetical protein
MELIESITDNLPWLKLMIIFSYYIHIRFFNLADKNSAYLQTLYFPPLRLFVVLSDYGMLE